MYESLGHFATYDARAELIGSIDGVDDALRDIGVTPIERGAHVDSLIRGIAVWKQNRDIKGGAQLLADLTSGVEALFRSERELYRDIARDRAENYRQVALELVRSKEVVSAPLVNRVLSAYDLQWPDIKEPFTDERTIAGIAEMIEVRSRTFEARSQDEAESVADALATLRAASERLAARGDLP